MEKTYKNSLYLIGLIFLFCFGLSIFAVYLADAINTKVVLFLFISTLFSSAISVTVLGGFFTSLTSYLLHMRRLFRMDNLSNPLLLRLSSEAPGTYHHSIIVSNMASKAAKTIGADSLLCRVSAYFHDIGKLKNPVFFVENQGFYKNEGHIQSKLNNPQKNAQIIIAHVKDGIKMAEEAHIPQDVINIIAQHHGDSTCVYFYEEAKNKDKTGVKKSDFQYPGPKPQNKNAAVLMLADSLEARARAKEDYNDIKDLVEKTFSDKIKERQLSESGFSEQEIFRLKKIFAEILETMFHPRIEYPK